MSTSDNILRPVRKNAGKLRLVDHKNTAELKTVKMPPPERVVIPMLQHIGQPCKPIVKPGDKVAVGTQIADGNDPNAVPIHASVSGTVAKITTIKLTHGNSCEAVVIDSDGQMTEDIFLSPAKVETVDELIRAARESGLVGLGGAGYPTHVKLNIPKGNVVDTLIINGAECEPYITSDYRECMEYPEDILRGTSLVKNILGIKRAIIAIEDNKPEAIKYLNNKSKELNLDREIEIMKLNSRYPGGAEKVLIYMATGRKLPINKLPSDIGCLVMNISTVSNLHRYIRTGMPLVSRRITVEGDCINKPMNVQVPIGTLIKDVAEFCGGYKSEPGKILMGGPMMGVALISDETPVIKQNNAILILSTESGMLPPATPCIRCGRCVEICPVNLMPVAIETAMRNPDREKLLSLGANYCIECGCCAYVCPARRPLVQVMRQAKKRAVKS